MVTESRSLYAVTFILLMFGLGHLRGEPILLARTALLALPGGALHGRRFSSMALCLTTSYAIGQAWTWRFGRS